MLLNCKQLVPFAFDCKNYCVLKLNAPICLFVINNNKKLLTNIQAAYSCTMKNRLNEKTENDIIKLSDQCINLNFCSVALSMDTVTPWQTGREQPTSEIAMESAMEYLYLQVSLIWSSRKESREDYLLMMNSQVSYYCLLAN